VLEAARCYDDHNFSPARKATHNEHGQPLPLSLWSACLARHLPLLQSLRPVVPWRSSDKWHRLDG